MKTMKACRVDRNQPEIVAACVAIGASVQHLHMVGRGCPDIVVGFRGKNYLFEIKDPLQPKSKQVLTPSEERWHQMWWGELHIVYTGEQAINILTRGEV